MSHRVFGGVVTVLGVVLLAPLSVAAQTPAAAALDSSAALTPWGTTDLQGIWDFRNITPLERPDEYSGRESLTAEEVAAADRDAATRAEPERRSDLTKERDVGLAYNQFWWDRGTSDGRTALIVDPPDGRIPYSAEGRQRAEDRRASRNIPATGPEDRSVGERCILGFNAGPPITPGGYNQNIQIFQTPDHVVILNEMVHDARLIPMDGRPHVGEHVRQWRGDSRAHWEGGTLVVDTTHFYAQTSFRGSSPNTHAVERFTLVDPATLLYEFTVDDPTTWEKPWTAQFTMTKTDAPLFEYACHEGNYGMTNLLAGARFQENASTGAKTK
jgi:hypothetical protein